MKDLRPVAVPLALAAQWLTSGSNFLAFKIALESLPPVAVVGLRLCAASVLILPFALQAWRRAPASKGQARGAITSGFLALVCGQGAVVYGMQHVPSGVGSAIAASSPLFLTIILSIVGPHRVSVTQWLGVVLGFFGVSLVALSTAQASAGGYDGIAMISVGAAMWSVSSIYQKSAEMPASSIVSLAMQMGPCGLVLLLLEFVSDRTFASQLAAVSLSSILAVGYLALFGSIVNFGIFVWLNRTTTTHVANSFCYVSPIVAFALGHWLLGEALTDLQLLAAGIGAVGVWLMIRRELPTP
jgi:drug/metabolite transporter (DMT)-like permease